MSTFISIHDVKKVKVGGFHKQDERETYVITIRIRDKDDKLTEINLFSNDKDAFKEWSEKE